MRTALSEDEQAVRDLFVDFFAKESPPETVRGAEPLGFDRGLWESLAALGAPGMALPAEAGGAGASLSDLAVVAEAWGAALAPVPLIEHAVATRLLHRAAPGHERLAALADGSQIATLALSPIAGDTARLVPAGAVADVVLAAACEQPASPAGEQTDPASGESAAAPDRGEVVLCCDDPPGVAPRTTGDLPVADRSLAGAERLSGDLAAWRLAVDEWRALSAVAYAGLARRVIETAVAYVSERRQFGVPVGSFQAIQHGLADASTRAEGARLLAYRAVWALDARRPDAGRLAPMALVFAAETGRSAADRALQYHGGYGYAEEYDVQLFRRRADSWILQIGGTAAEIRRLGTLEFGDPAQDDRSAAAEQADGPEAADPEKAR